MSEMTPLEWSVFRELLDKVRRVADERRMPAAKRRRLNGDLDLLLDELENGT